MVRVAKSVVESNEDPEQKYYEDEVNFLRHRNPWAGYYHYSPEAEEGTCREHYYTEYPTYSGKLDGGDESHYSWAEDEAAGTWKRYTNRELEKDDGCNTPATWNDRMYATNLFFQKTETENATTYYVFTNPSTGGVYKSTQSNLSDDTDPGRPADWEDYVPMSGYLYYRVKVPGVDSSSFHDHVSYGMENSKMVFFNAKGEKLVPYIDFTQVGDEHSNPKSDTLRYYLVREVAGVEYNYRCQLGTNIEDLTLQERHWDAGAYTDWTAVDAHASDLPEEEDLFPDHKVPFHTYSSGDANDGGIRRAGYTHLPMQWFTHGYNHGTLMQRDSASAFLGRPYRDETKALTQAYYYNTPLSTDVGNRNNEMTEEFGSLYNNPMIPRYLRTYIAYKLNPTIHPDDAVPEASTNPVDVYMSSDVGLSSPLDLEVTEFCAGDIVQLRPNPNASSPNWNFMAWDFDASAEENATFVVEGNNLTPTAYYSPGDYWYQVVTSLPLPEEDNFVRHYNGSVTVKSKEGLAWLISVVNGYNGQNSHTFENDTVFIDFSGIGSHTVDMSEHKWTPLGNLNNPFKGVFMPLPETINTTTEEEFKASLPVINGIIVNENSVQRVGFFGYTYNAELRQFKVNDITLKGASYVGGITAHAVNTKIKNVYVGAEAKSKSVNLFGEQVIGGIVGKGESDTINSNAFNGYLRGHAIYAGSLLGEGLDCYGTGNGSGNSKVDVTGLVALYFGGLVGIVEDNDVTKTGGQSNFSNNYVSIVTGEYNYRIGGLVGRAENIDLRNNYVYGQAKGTIYTGGLVGYVGNNVEITNCYFVDGMTGNAWGYNTHPNSVRKWTTFFGSGNNVKMREPVDGYTNLTRALNRWVFAHGDSIYKTWRSALPGENHGYPVFGDPDIITVRDSVHTTVCDNIEWDGITFNESGRYIFHVVDSSDYLDSTFTLVLTVHHSDSTTFADSVTLGQGYNGYGLSLTADELQQLFGNDRTVEVVALRYVDSLLTAQGCDSLVVLTLYVVNDNVGVPQAQQQLIDVKVYPNPTLGSVNVEGSGLKSIEVYDNVSHRILSRNAASDHEQFDLSGYPSGNYFIRVRTAYGTVVKKLIKK